MRQRWRGCPDIHIEYPTPESFFIAGFNSEKIRQIHQVSFDRFDLIVRECAQTYNLCG